MLPEVRCEALAPQPKRSKATWVAWVSVGWLARPGSFGRQHQDFMSVKPDPAGLSALDQAQTAVQAALFQLD